MYILKECPICKSIKYVKYYGIYYDEDNNIREIYRCNNINYHIDNQYYTFDKLKTYLYLEVDKFNEILKDRIKCPKFKEHKDFNPDKPLSLEHKYQYIVSKGNSNRFYCRYHKNRPHNKYEFRYIDKKADLSLRNFLKDLSPILYKKMYKIYKQDTIYNIKKDEDGLLDFCFMIQLSDKIIATIFHSSQQTINRLKHKRTNLENIANIYTLSITTHKNIFSTKIKVSKKDFDTLQELLLNNEIDF